MTTRPAFVAAVASLLFVGACASAQAQPARDDAREHAAFITVAASAQIKAPPDEVRIDLAVITKAASPGDALDDNSKRMERVMGALLDLGLARKEIETTRVAVRPDFRYDQREGQRIVGYIVENHVRATTANLDLAGAIIQKGVDAGASSVASVAFGLADEQPQRLKAIADATRRARAEADAAAQAAGVRIVRVRSIQIGGGVSAPPYPLTRAMGAETLAVAPTEPPVSPGDITVSATITATFEIE